MVGTLLTRDPAHVHQNCFAVNGELVSASNADRLSRDFAEPVRKNGAIPQEFETPGLETPNLDSAGLLLIDALLRPLYVNDEAVSILSYASKPQTPRGNGHVSNLLQQRIDSLLPKRNGRPDLRFPSEFASGRRHYQVRVFALRSNFGNHSGATLAVLLERNRERGYVLRAARRFDLTQRETEALELLSQEYTTKQIASRMDISPNTAKAFLRCVMFKSGASDRAGILAKILQL